MAVACLPERIHTELECWWQ